MVVLLWSVKAKGATEPEQARRCTNQDVISRGGLMVNVSGLDVRLEAFGRRVIHGDLPVAIGAWIQPSHQDLQQDRRKRLGQLPDRGGKS